MSTQTAVSLKSNNGGTVDILTDPSTGLVSGFSTPYGVATLSPPLAPTTAQTFEQAIAGYKKVQDFAFGTLRKFPGVTQIDSTTELAKYFDYWAYNLGTATTTINAENQRYVDMTHTNNFVFATDALELTATMPNGTPLLLSTTLSAAAATKQNQITVTDASNINVGQVLSFGPSTVVTAGTPVGGQYAQQCLTRTYAVRGTVAAGSTATLTFTPMADLGVGTVPQVFSYVATASDTNVTIAQAIVNQVNANAVLASFGITAYKDPSPNGAYYVVFPKLAAGADPYGNCSTGSFTYFSYSTAQSGTGFVHGAVQTMVVTYVVAKSGNVLTLNHNIQVAIASGATVYINPSRMLMRPTTYSGGSAIVPVIDTVGMTVGQGVQVGFQDNNIRRITAIDSTSTPNTITLSASVGLVDGVFLTTLPVWLAVPSVASTGTTATVLTANLSSNVRVGQQVSVYNATTGGNFKILSLTTSGTSTLIGLDGAMTLTTGYTLVFHEPIESAQIWSKWGTAPGVDGYENIALELECDPPDCASIAAWPAFWLFTDPTNSTGIVDTVGTGEIDMFDGVKNVSHSTVGGCYAPSASTPVTYGYGGLTAAPLTGNNLNGQKRKIQVVISRTQVFYYLDGVLMFVKTFQVRRSYRAQIAANLAVGTLSTGFNSQGFFPIDQSMFPAGMKFRVRRMRVFGS